MSGPKIKGISKSSIEKYKYFTKETEIILRLLNT